MKPKTLVLMVVAVTCGLGASYMTSRLLADRHTDDAEKVAVLVAKRTVNNGETIKVPPDLFEEKLYVKGEEPRDAIAKLEDLKGRVLKKALRQGDFIRADDLLDSRDPQSAFSYNLPQGYRAIGQRVNIESIAGGFASLPLSRVDVILTVRRGDDKSSFAQIILQNVLVLAADAKTARDEGGNAMPATTVTFALSPKDAMTLTLSREVGTLSLMLRKFNDNEKSTTEKLTMADVKNGTPGHLGTENGDEGTEGSQGVPGPVIGSLPPLNGADAKPAVDAKTDVAAQPSGINHKLEIYDGDKTRSVSFLLDPVTRRVINQEVTRTDVNSTPNPRPPLAESKGKEEKSPE